jgi:tetratricopeptide (TPR) repeat protein
MIKTVTTVTVSLALLIGTTARLYGQPTASQIAADEAVKREAMTIQLRRTLEDAQKLRKKGDLEAAARLFEEAYSTVQSIGVGVETERTEAISGLVAVNLELAEQAQRRSDLTEADTRVKRALRVDPKNEAAQKFKKKNDDLIEQKRGQVASQEVRSRLPDIREERIKTSTLVQDGRLLIEMGRVDEAEAKLKEAYKRDPENKPAVYYLTLITEVRFNQEARKREIVAKNRLVEVEDAWNTPIKRDRLPDGNPFARTNLIYTGPGRQMIQHKLDTITLQEVIYDGIPLSEVVKDLTAEARRRDPHGAGHARTIGPGRRREPPVPPRPRNQQHHAR